LRYWGCVQGGEPAPFAEGAGSTDSPGANRNSREAAGPYRAAPRGEAQDEPSNRGRPGSVTTSPPVGDGIAARLDAVVAHGCAPTGYVPASADAPARTFFAVPRRWFGSVAGAHPVGDRAFRCAGNEQLLRKLSPIATNVAEKG
jgi:hypothetical protein